MTRSRRYRHAYSAFDTWRYPEWLEALQAVESDIASSGVLTGHKVEALASSGSFPEAKLDQSWREEVMPEPERWRRLEPLQVCHQCSRVLPPETEGNLCSRSCEAAVLAQERHAATVMGAEASPCSPGGNAGGSLSGTIDKTPRLRSLVSILTVPSQSKVPSRSCKEVTH